MAKRTREAMRKHRHARVRKNLAGTAEKPRLNVYRSLNRIYAQVIDDSSARTLVSASTIDPEIRVKIKDLSKTEQAKLVGSEVAKRALASGIATVVFDRGGYRYQGRVRALAEAAREAGLKF